MTKKAFPQVFEVRVKSMRQTITHMLRDDNFAGARQVISLAARLTPCP